MKRTARRLLSLLMAVVLCLGLTPVTAWAANFPSKFYASVTYKYESNTKYEIFGTVTQSADTLTYSRTGEKMDRVVYGMEYAGGVFFTVEGNKLPRNEDDGLRELRMYNSDLTSYRTIGTVNQENGGYWIIDTAMDLSGTEPALYGTYNQSLDIGGTLMAFTTICSIDLTDGHTSNWLQVKGDLPSTDILYAIAFDEGGTLYAIGADAGADGGPASLYTIELGETQATATKVGDIKTSSGSLISTNYCQDLAFDHNSNTLYWAENAENVLYTVDAASAAATKVGSLPTLQSFCIPYDAAFAGNKHMVSVICEGAGEVTSSEDEQPFYMVENNGRITLNITPDAGSGLRYVKVDGNSISTANLVENGYTFENVTGNHVIEVGFKLAIPAEQHDMTWFHYQGEPASFYTVDNVYKFYDLPYLDKEVPRDGYTQTLLDEKGQPIDDDEIILPGDYGVHVIHPGNDKYAALDVIYENALQLAKCPGTPGRPVVYGKVGCTQGDLSTTSALQDYYGTDGTLIDAAYDEIPVTLVWQNPETRYDTAGNFSASATIHAADELEQRLKDCYTLDNGDPLEDGCQISPRATQVVVLPADEASLVKLQTSDASGGTVSGKGVYKNGDSVTVTATVNGDAGFTFGGWRDESGQIVSDNLAYTFNADGDRTLTALFEVSDGYRVTLQTDPADAGTVTGGGSYEEGDHRTTVKAAPNQGYYFIGWYDGDAQKSADSEYTFAVEEEGITLTAKFGIDYLARAEQARTNFESALGTDAFEWQTLVQAVDAYEAAADFVENPPSVIEDAQNRYDALTTYYNGIQALDLSDQDIGNDDLAKLYLFTGITDLNLGGNKDITSLANLAHMTQLETLDLSGTGVTDLNGLPNHTGLETLNLSNNKGIADLSALKELAELETLDISGTGVTALDSLVPEGDSSFPGYQNLTAKNLTLNSVSALAQLVGADDFDAGSVAKWDFTGSTLPDTAGSKADVEAIQGKLSNEQFIPPTFRTTPDPTPVPTPAEYGVVVADCAHGKVTAEPAKAAEGATVVLTVAPEEGYELRSIEAVGADGAAVELAENADGTFSFTMPAGNVTVAATFGCDGGELCPSHGFADVDQGQWYHEAIDWAVSNKVLNGFDDTGLMMPDADLTRAQMAQILWNIEGNPVVDYLVTFGDVREDDWHHDAIAWAASEGIFEGYDDGSGLFGPDDALTREQAAAVLMRWTKANGGDVTARADLSGYPDAEDVSEWAVEYVQWAVAVGIVSGVEQPDGTLLLDAQGTSSRAMAATLMMRLVG